MFVIAETWKKMSYLRAIPLRHQVVMCSDSNLYLSMGSMSLMLQVRDSACSVQRSENSLVSYWSPIQSQTDLLDLVVQNVDRVRGRVTSRQDQRSR